MERLLFTLVLPFWLSAQNPSLIQQAILNGDTIDINHDTITLTSSEYGLVILFSNESNTDLYCYKLDGFDNDYIKSKHPTAIYPPLRNQSYTFHAYTITNGVKSPGTSMYIIVHHSFLQSWGFAFVLAFYLLLLFGGALFFALLSSFRSKDKMQAMRGEWSLRLHNSIGNDLASVSGRIEILKKKLIPLDEKTSKNLDKMQRVLKNVLTKLRFVFDILDPDKNTLQTVFDKLHVEAQDILSAKEITFDYQNHLAPDEIMKIDIGRIDKLYLAIKEAIGNIAKHADATQASLHIQRTKEGLKVHITDNGKGFDVNALHAGNGMANLHKYAKKAIMEPKVTSELGKGTTISLLIPEL